MFRSSRVIATLSLMEILTSFVIVCISCAFSIYLITKGIKGAKKSIKEIEIGNR